MVRRFEVWLDRNIPGVETDVEVIEFADNATEKEIEDTCAETLDVMISNVIDSGWREIKSDEASKRMED